jgi:hypothetical protein
MSCTEIVLAAGTFCESPTIARSLTLRGDGSSLTFIQGGLDVTAGEVILEKLHFASGDEPLRVHSGARVSGFEIIAVVGWPGPSVFADNFESGDVTAWSSWTREKENDDAT